MASNEAIAEAIEALSAVAPRVKDAFATYSRSNGEYTRGTWMRWSTVLESLIDDLRKACDAPAGDALAIVQGKSKQLAESADA